MHVAAAAGAFAALLALPTPASAFCRAVTASPPAGFDPADGGCFGFSDGGVMAGLFPLFWRNACVSYSFQPSASKYISLADAERVGGEAFAAWSSAACPGGPPSIRAVEFPEVNCGSVPSAEHSNVIIFRDGTWPYDDSANAIGYTTLTVDLTTGEILGADTEINSAQWTIVAEPPAPTNGYDFATIMTHEAGHFLGLAHTADATAVMYSRYHPDTTLQADDIAAICSVYHPDGTHDTSLGPFAAPSCDPEPPAGFLSATCGSFDAGTVNLMSVGSGSSPSADGLTSPCPPDDSGCSVSEGASHGGMGRAGVATAGLVAAAALLRLARRSIRRRRSSSSGRGSGGVVLGVTLALAGASFGSEREARASVSAAAVFDDLVKDSSAIAVVTPVEQSATWEDNRIVTVTRLRVDRVVAGLLPAAVAVRTHGGSVGRIGQIVEGQASFTPGVASLVFLRPHVDPGGHVVADTFVVVASAQGQFPIATVDGKGPRLERATNVGALLDPPNKPAGARYAGDALAGRMLEDAVRDIAAAFRRTHA